MGGKHRLVPQLVALLPKDTHCYVEVFGGSGAVLLNKPPSPVEVFNDIDNELVNLFMTVRDHPTQFIRAVQSLPYSRILRDDWRTQFYRGRWPRNRVERAVRYYYLVRCSFFGHIDKGWRFALKTDEAARLYNCVGEVEEIAQRLAHVHIDHKDFRACIQSYDRPDTGYYLDPPYFGSVPYRKGIPPFTETDHVDLARILTKVHGRWLLTYNDHPRIRELYKGFEIFEVVTRLNTDKLATANRRPFRQLIMRNY
jgi:DNA adenine methylase